MLGSGYCGSIILAVALNVCPSALSGGGGLGSCYVGSIIPAAGCVTSEYSPPSFDGGGGLGSCYVGAIIPAAGCVRLSTHPSQVVGYGGLGFCSVGSIVTAAGCVTTTYAPPPNPSAGGGSMPKKHRYYDNVARRGFESYGSAKATIALKCSGNGLAVQPDGAITIGEGDGEIIARVGEVHYSVAFRSIIEASILSEPVNGDAIFSSEAYGSLVISANEPKATSYASANADRSNISVTGVGYGTRKINDDTAIAIALQMLL